ncbi:hypothetical protein VNI00_003298 [Paramarasmius palmivorus]|uniref:Uncharacterized protein n=1 Tax=Paramarasmius palmivorus TaxID=297713 RepID=A0AAW0DU28_9AGAR
MLGLEGYGSGSDSDDNAPQVAPPKPKKSTTTSTSTTKSSSLSLPPPSGAKGKRKVAIGLPALKPLEDEEQGEEEKPAAKKPRLESGAGRSSLLSMLPAPKQKAPVLPAPQRVLGGGGGPGLVFNRTTSLGKPRAPPRTVPSKPAAPAVDFFSLGSSSKSSAPSIPTSSSSITISSAPDLPTFEPPEPSVNDPYPGYYQLPSGQWAAHDPVYFEKFRKKWENDYNAHVRALEKGTAKGFEAYDRGEVEEVDAAKEMERAKEEIKEREERKAITKVGQGASEKPKMTITASKMSGIARSRHQLATMLNEAYTNREALGREDCRRTEKSQRSRQQIWFLNISSIQPIRIYIAL